jgi:hypothetical protein
MSKRQRETMQTTPTLTSNVSMPRYRQHCTHAVARCTAAIALLLLCQFDAARAQGATSRNASPATSAQATHATQESLATPARSSGTHTVDHRAYDALLKRFVIDGHVDYDGFANDPSFARYLASLDAVNPSTLDDAERLAFWLNVYNAFTVHLIVQHHETASIRNIEKSFGFLRLKGPWSAPIVRAAGRRLTLDDVEHQILRTEFSDPRIHFALVYGALGSPPLRSEAYRGATLDAQLNDQGRRFLRESPSQNRLQKLERARVLVLSPIFTYYRADFGATKGDLGRFLARWLDAGDREWLQRGSFWTTESTFDWTLNSQRKAAEVAGRMAPDSARARTVSPNR